MELEQLLPFIGIVAIIVVSRLLSGIGRKQKPRPERIRVPDPDPARQMQSNGYDMYLNIPFEQAANVQTEKKKKKKRSTPPVQTKSKPVGEASIMQAKTPDTGQKKSFPVFSENPVVNGIVWAEVITRGGTRRSVHR